MSTPPPPPSHKNISPKLISKKIPPKFHIFTLRFLLPDTLAACIAILWPDKTVKEKKEYLTGLHCYKIQCGTQNSCAIDVYTEFGVCGLDEDIMKSLQISNKGSLRYWAVCGWHGHFLRDCNTATTRGLELDSTDWQADYLTSWRAN